MTTATVTNITDIHTGKRELSTDSYVSVSRDQGSKIVSVSRQDRFDVLTFDITAAMNGEGTITLDGTEVGAFSFDTTNDWFGVVFTTVPAQGPGCTSYHPYKTFNSFAEAVQHAAYEFL